MAEALLRAGLQAQGLDASVSSAGIGALDGKPVDPLATKVLKERGIDISAHRSSQYSSVASLEHDLILVMTNAMRDTVLTDCPSLHGRVYRLGHWSNVEVADPHMRGEAAFRKALKLIDTGVSEWLERIV